MNHMIWTTSDGLWEWGRKGTFQMNADVDNRLFYWRAISKAECLSQTRRSFTLKWTIMDHLMDLSTQNFSPKWKVYNLAEEYDPVFKYTMLKINDHWRKVYDHLRKVYDHFLKKYNSIQYSKIQILIQKTETITISRTVSRTKKIRSLGPYLCDHREIHTKAV